MKNHPVTVQTDQRGVTTLAMNRPDQHNAFDRAMIDALQSTLDDLAGTARLLVLTGNGRSFCAGADLQWMRHSMTLSSEANRADAIALSTMLHTLDTFAAPVVARVHGAAIGGGAGLVSCCDLAVADETAVFGFSEVRLGLIPATISPYVLQAIGARAARHWFLTGARFDAMAACGMGLVHRTCDGQSLDRVVDDVVTELLAGGAEAQSECKRLIRDVQGQACTSELRDELGTRLAMVRSGPEAQEGLAAFRDKRKPAWCAEPDDSVK